MKTPRTSRTVEPHGMADQPRMERRLLAVSLECLPLILLVGVFLVFSALAPGFHTSVNLRNILVQSSSVAIVAVGMTYVLLTGGIDLSVGSIMFLAAAVAGRLALGDWISGLGPVPVGLVVASSWSSG